MVLGTTLAALALGLVPFAVTLVQMRVFYAMKDARTPALINAIMVGVRIPLLIVCADLDDAPDRPRDGRRDLDLLPGRGHRRRDLAARPVRPDGHQADPGHAAEDDHRRRRRAPAAALLAGNGLLHFEVDDLGEALLEILLSGTVGLLVIAAVAVLLKVEELVPLRNRIAGLGPRRILRRGSPNPGAAPASRTLVVAPSRVTTYSAADRAPQHGTLSRHQQRTMASDDRHRSSDDPHPSSREQVANPVPNDSGGPAVRVPTEITRPRDSRRCTDHDPGSLDRCDRADHGRATRRQRPTTTTAAR